MSSVAAHVPVPAVGVVTVSYGSEDVLARFLDSVPRSSTRALAVVIADNRPVANGTIEQIAGSRGASYLPMDDNLGYGGGLNAAVAALDPAIEWVLLSNPDVELGIGAVDTLLDAASTDPKIAAIGPRVLTPKGETYPSARAIPSLRTGIGHAIFANVWTSNPWTRAYRRDADYSPAQREAGWLSGSCLLVRRDAFAEIGGFDSAFFMYFEDVDLGYRLGRAGYKNMYEPAAVVTHTGAHATTSDSARMIIAHHESARRFLSRKYSRWYLFPVRAALTVGLRLRAAALTRHPGHH